MEVKVEVKKDKWCCIVDENDNDNDNDNENDNENENENIERFFKRFLNDFKRSAQSLSACSAGLRPKWSKPLTFNL